MRSTPSVTAACLTLACMLAAPVASAAPQEFASPQEAVRVFLEALAADDVPKMIVIFGPEHEAALFSNPERGSEYRAELAALAEAAQWIRGVSENLATLVIGEEPWPFPIQIRRDGEQWHFDTAAGLEEIKNRRIGENELSAIEVASVYVEAQVEYASVDRDGDHVREYAQRLLSTPGNRDGLYWPLPEGADGPLSPFGPLDAEELDELKASQREGYHFRILTSQGASPPGGAYDYVINGNMIAGFALVAYPVEHGETGIETFVVSHDGEVFEKDLGGASVTTYNPDATWTVVTE